MKNSESSYKVLLVNNLYRFGQFALDPAKRTLSRADSPVLVTPKAFDVLIFLVQNPNRLVTKEELLQAVWGDTFVEEGNLTQYISHLRKALGGNSEDNRLIVTIARKGYQFTGDVVVAEAAGAPKQVAVQTPALSNSRPDARPALEFPTQQAVPKAGKLWRRAAVVSAFGVILVATGYMSWRRFRPAALPGTGKIMLAVLPFENLTGDHGKEYLADGLTQETISQLGMLNPEQLGVIARTSVIGYEHKAERLDQIGRDLSVEYVLEDSLRESGDQVRITSLLLRVKDQSLLWSQDYDYPAKNVLGWEDNVAKAVARQIQVRLTPREQAALSRQQTVNPEAFDAYLQGYYFFERATDQDTERAGRYFERAIKMDPSYALAWVGLSRVRNWEANEGLVPPKDGQRLAHDAVERALALDPNLPEAYSQMGRLQEFDDFDWRGADASFQRAMSLEPEDPVYIRQAAEMAGNLRRFGSALEGAHKAVDLDPLNADSWATLGEVSVFAGQLREAEADYRKALELNPDTWAAPIWLSYMDLMEGRAQDALQEAARVQVPTSRLQIYAIGYDGIGQKKESDAALTELIARYSATGAFTIATVYAYRNQRDQAFEWLNRAYVEHDSNLCGTAIYPFISNLRGDPRYSALLKKLHMPS
jgi:DNA-binding winged helix-turn-helix (wHTH) protein/TolB-like protein